jgi:hypothetical protein
VLNGISASRCNEENPMPKSSIAQLNPLMRNWLIAAAKPAFDESQASSVISISRCAVLIPFLEKRQHSVYRRRLLVDKQKTFTACLLPIVFFTNQLLFAQDQCCEIYCAAN